MDNEASIPDVLNHAFFFGDTLSSEDVYHREAIAEIQRLRAAETTMSEPSTSSAVSSSVIVPPLPPPPPPLSPMNEFFEARPSLERNPHRTIDVRRGNETLTSNQTNMDFKDRALFDLTDFRNCPEAFLPNYYRNIHPHEAQRERDRSPHIELSEFFCNDINNDHRNSLSSFRPLVTRLNRRAPHVWSVVSSSVGSQEQPPDVQSSVTPSEVPNNRISQVSSTTTSQAQQSLQWPENIIPQLLNQPNEQSTLWRDTVSSRERYRLKQKMVMLLQNVIQETRTRCMEVVTDIETEVFSTANSWLEYRDTVIQRCIDAASNLSKGKVSSRHRDKYLQVFLDYQSKVRLSQSHNNLSDIHIVNNVPFQSRETIRQNTIPHSTTTASTINLASDNLVPLPSMPLQSSQSTVTREGELDISRFINMASEHPRRHLVGHQAWRIIRLARRQSMHHEMRDAARRHRSNAFTEEMEFRRRNRHAHVADRRMIMRAALTEMRYADRTSHPDVHQTDRRMRVGERHSVGISYHTDVITRRNISSESDRNRTFHLNTSFREPFLYFHSNRESNYQYVHPTVPVMYGQTSMTMSMSKVNLQILGIAHIINSRDYYGVSRLPENLRCNEDGCNVHKPCVYRRFADSLKKKDSAVAA